MKRLCITLFLVVLALPARAEQFSIKCNWTPDFVITFDEERMRVISESFRDLTHMSIIDSVSADEIQFHLLASPGSRLAWKRSSSAIVSVDSLPDGSRFEDSCPKTKLRPVMSQWDQP